MKLCKIMGPKWTHEQLPLLLDACHLTTEPERSICHDYIYQLVMRKSTTELGFFNLFNNGCQAHFPLGNKTFEMPMSFIIGDKDWVLYCDRHDSKDTHWGKILVETNQKKHGNDKCKFHYVPNAGHNMHLDNRKGFPKIILDDYEAYEKSISEI